MASEQCEACGHLSNDHLGYGCISRVGFDFDGDRIECSCRLTGGDLTERTLHRQHYELTEQGYCFEPVGESTQFTVATPDQQYLLEGGEAKTAKEARYRPAYFPDLPSAVRAAQRHATENEQ